MLGALFRLVGMVCFAIALVAGVLDLARSIADQALVLTPLHADWLRYSPYSLELVRNFIAGQLHPWLWSPVGEKLLSAPTWSIFGIISMVFAMTARRRKHRWQENFGA